MAVDDSLPSRPLVATATRAPSFLASMAAIIPAIPEPITRMSVAMDSVSNMAFLPSDNPAGRLEHSTSSLRLRTIPATQYESSPPAGSDYGTIVLSSAVATHG